jgi:trk system potassium uptake protein TrkH
MRLLMFIHFLGKWIVLFGTALVPSIIVAALYQDGELGYFLLALLVNTAIGGGLWIVGGRHRLQLKLHDGFILVVAMWLATSLIACVHLVFSLGLGVTDAFFEAVSALTTTGATVITGLDSLPPSVLMFRQILQWLGGIGVVVSAVALLPMLGVGGMQMIKAEAPGPFKGEKLTPRIQHTAAALWKLYLVITVACALAYWFAGMSAFDAVAHSFSTVSTGGFSTHDASFAYFDSAVIESLAIVFMLVGATSFAVHWMAWHRLSIEGYGQSEEIKAFVAVVALAIVLVAAELYVQGSRETIAQAFRASSFTVVSVITSTGFGVDNFSLWPSFLPTLLILISFIGGCGGSTAGGMKVVRFVILFKAIRLELFNLVHPRGVKSLQLQGRTIETRALDGVMGFVSLHIVIVAVLVLLMMALGMDLETAFGAVASCINNLGPGLGEVAADFQSVSAVSKWILAFTMLLGRLEIFTFLVLFSPAFWRN